MPETENHIKKTVIDSLDETFDVSQSESYHLSIQTEPGGLSFCVFNTVINKYVVLRSYPLLGADSLASDDEYRNIFENDELLKLKYKSCSHLLISTRCTLVPDHLFDTACAASYLNFNHGWKAGERTMQNYIRSANLYNIFSYPERLVSLLKQYQPDIKFSHQATPFIESIVEGQPSSVKPRVAVYYYSNCLDIVVVANKKLLFYNTFPITSPEDSVYYFVSVMNLFDIEISSTKLYYAGSIKDMPPQVKILGQYVDQFVECEPIHSVVYSHCLDVSWRRHFIHLFNLYACGS